MVRWAVYRALTLQWLKRRAPAIRVQHIACELPAGDVGRAIDDVFGLAAAV